MKRKDYRIRIHTSPQVGKLLEQLAGQGIYGRSVADVAERLMCRQLEQLLSAQRSLPKEGTDR
jgi:hypothetical protein